MMETLSVVLIVVAAAFYVGRIFYRGFKQKEGCACGCTGCSISDSCSQPAADEARNSAPAQEDP